MDRYKELKLNLIKESAKLFLPVFGEFELTNHCNLKCEMCYVSEDKCPSFDTEQWKQLFFQCVQAGMFFALLTGGEVFSRPDFKELYLYLYQQGVRISIYSNGTLISEEIAEWLEIYPPEYVAITLYGESDETYERVTKVKQGFTKMNQGLDLLRKHSIPVVLRTLPLPVLFPKIDQLIDYTKTKNLLMGYSLYIGPNHENKLGNRLSATDLILFEQKIGNAFGIYEPFEKSHDEGTCVALKSTFYVTHDGWIQPCAMFSTPKEKIGLSFQNTWLHLVQAIKQNPICSECGSCQVKESCIECPAKRHLEGNMTKCSPYLKEIAWKRHEVYHGNI